LHRFSPAYYAFFGTFTKQVETLSILGSIITLILGIALVVEVYRHEVIITWQNALFADAFSAFIVLIVSIVGFVASIYSVGYMGTNLSMRSLT